MDEDVVETARLLPTESASQAPLRHLGVLSAAALILNRCIGTGIFSIPSGIYELSGSVGWTLFFWVLGGVLAACGFSVYFEYGLEMPESGGEKNYLQRVYRKPKDLFVTLFAVGSVVLSFSSSNSYAFGMYLQLACGRNEPNEQLTRYIAVVTVLAICLLHARYPGAGRKAFNFFGIVKIIILLLIAFCVPLIYFGLLGDEAVQHTMHNNFKNMWQNDGFGGGLYELSVAMLRVSYSYRGWETCNMVMGEVLDPFHTVGLAGPLAIGSLTILYFLCTIAYFMVIPKSEVRSSGTIIAGVFLLKLFGESAAARLLPLCICLSNFGNILVVTYAASRVTQAVGKSHILPFSEVLASNRPWGTPFAGLAVHFTMTALTLLLPPPGEVYNFVIDVSTYPVTFFASAITVGLIYLHHNKEEEGWGLNPEGWHTPTIFIIAFLIGNAVTLVFPWFPPPASADRHSTLPSWASPLAATSILLMGTLYWYIRRV